MTTDDDGFEDAFARTVGHEGGFQADRKDRGNWTGGRIGAGELRGTRFGISAAAYPREDIAGLTLDRAHELYRRDYWIPAGCPVVPAELRAGLFDAAVHHGPDTARRMLQAAAGAVADGIIGPRTLQALRDVPAPRVLARLLGARLELMAGLPSWDTFSEGWAKRIARELQRV